MENAPRCSVFIAVALLFQAHSIESRVANAHQSRRQVVGRALPEKRSLANARHSARMPMIARKTVCQVGFGVAEGLAAIDAFFLNHPYISSFMITGFKGSMADATAQLAERRSEKKDDTPPKPFNWLRNLAFILYAGSYQGCIQNFLFNTMFSIWFGVGTSFRTVLSKVCFELLVLSPFLCLPLAYLTRAALFDGPSLTSMREGVSRYVYDVRSNGLLTKYWMLWGPVQILTFSVIPTHLRIAFITCVSFFWMILLSTLMGESQEGESDEDLGAEDSVAPVSLVEHDGRALLGRDAAVYNDMNQDVLVYWWRQGDSSWSNSSYALLRPQEIAEPAGAMDLKVCVEYCALLSGGEMMPRLFQPLEPLACHYLENLRCPAGAQLGITCNSDVKLADTAGSHTDLYVSNFIHQEQAVSQSFASDYVDNHYAEIALSVCALTSLLVALFRLTFVSFRQPVHVAEAPLLQDR